MKYLIFILYLIFGILSSCSESSPTKIIDLSSYNDRSFSGFGVKNINTFIVSNKTGPITVYGNGLKDTVITYLNKTIYAETDDIARERIDDIKFQYTIDKDSVKCFISSPENSAKLQFESYYSLETFGNKVTYVNSPNSGASFYYMDTTVYVLDSSGDIFVKYHNGSCDMNTAKGSIEVEMIIPKNGFGRCKTLDGNIKLRIPMNSSATIFAKSNSGIINYSNLSISNIQETPGLLQGVLDTGNGEIHLETDNGNIEIIGF